MSPLLQERAEGGAAEGEPAPRLQLPRERSRAHVRGGGGINRSRNGRGWLRSELPGRGLELPGRVHAPEAEGWCCCAARAGRRILPAGPRGPALLPTGVWDEHIPCALKDFLLREGREKD
ncbi:hypothetical protein J1605_013341 [Eschrichtius robustus]|uniref:Uncharacterized protein n=1 Tax=Eschrichtius robustus TaxID=9764 RepID=A0AB34GG88_ESCRO|nr:hypothetical protein J1605_013341 [Eschrichtius robustus]